MVVPTQATTTERGAALADARAPAAQRDQDDEAVADAGRTGPAHGIVIGLGLSALLWVALLAGAWVLFVR
jgi:hypothetical protein